MHFTELAERYPLVEFEKSMTDFIQMVLNSMDTPKLDKVGFGDDWIHFPLVVFSMYHDTDTIIHSTKAHQLACKKRQLSKTRPWMHPLRCQSFTNSLVMAHS